MSPRSALGRKLQRVGTPPGSGPKAPAPGNAPAGDGAPGPSRATAPASALRLRTELPLFSGSATGIAPTRETGDGMGPAFAPGSPFRGGTVSPPGIGIPEPTAHGVLNVTLRQYGAHHCHGRVRVASALAARPAHVAAIALDPAL